MILTSDASSFLNGYFKSYWYHLGHIDDHMPTPDGSCGVQTHDSGILRLGPYSLRDEFVNIAKKNDIK